MDFLIYILSFLIGLACGLAVSHFRTEAIYQLYINSLQNKDDDWWKRGENPPWEDN